MFSNITHNHIELCWKQEAPQGENEVVSSKNILLTIACNEINKIFVNDWEI